MAAAGTLVALTAEFIGTFLLTLVSCASVTGSVSEEWGPTAVAFTYMALIYSFSGVSGGHLNPAVTLASALAQKFPWWTTLYYIVAQIFGGALGGGVYTLLFQAAQFEPKGSFGYWQPMVVEGLYTAMLAFVVLSVTSVRNLNFNQYYALASGFVLVAGGHAAGPVSGAALNPAVSLGAGLTSGDGGLALQAFLYVHYQCIGAALAALVFVATRPEDYAVSEDRVRDYSPALTTSLIGEFVGTFLVSLTMGLVVLAESPATAWATGAAVLSMLYSLGDVSGGNLNPAITLAAGMLKRGCTTLEGLAYIFFQLLGGFLAALTCAGVYSNLFAIAPVAPFSVGAALLMEFLFTLMVVYAYLSTVCAKGIVTPLGRSYFFGISVGFATAAGMFVASRISGGFLNPALSFGFGLANVATVQGSFMTAFLYILIQLAGSIVATGLFHCATSAPYAALGEKVL